MPLASITLSSVGTSTPANLNWRGGKPTTVVINTSGSSATFTVEFTLDDLQLIGGTSLASWVAVSSNTYAIDTTGPMTFGASDVPVYIPFPGPIAAIRMNVSSNSGSIPMVMKVMQGEGW